MCVCEDGWYDVDCKLKRQDWFSDEKSKVQESCTGEGNKKQCKFTCGKDENGNEQSCLKVFMKEKEVCLNSGIIKIYHY